MTLRIDNIQFENPLIAAPMAGVTDRPFRALCRKLGAGAAVSEMLTADKRLWHTPKSRLRMDHRGETGPVWVQIAGGDADMMSEAAQLNQEHGAELIDINMGCPAKKVCNKLAGSALMGDLQLVESILSTVVRRVGVPVTLKIRTGPSRDNRNGVDIARLAEQCGVSAISVHGRTREDRFTGIAEFDTVAEIKRRVRIAVIANGDITSGQHADRILKYTGADGLMIGRGCQGNPWLFNQVNHYLRHGKPAEPPCAGEILSVMVEHLQNLHEFYGEHAGVRVARKHIGWYLKRQAGTSELIRTLMPIETAAAQIDVLSRHFSCTAAAVAA